jgi:hypothetical protein
VAARAEVAWEVAVVAWDVAIAAAVVALVDGAAVGEALGEVAAAGAIARVKAAVVGSLTLTVKWLVPAAVGVPEMTPPALSVKPSGKTLPVARDQV